MSAFGVFFVCFVQVCCGITKSDWSKVNFNHSLDCIHLDRLKMTNWLWIVEMREREKIQKCEKASLQKPTETSHICWICNSTPFYNVSEAYQQPRLDVICQLFLSIFKLRVPPTGKLSLQNYYIAKTCFLRRYVRLHFNKKMEKKKKKEGKKCGKISDSIRLAWTREFRDSDWW